MALQPHDERRVSGKFQDAPRLLIQTDTYGRKRFAGRETLPDRRLHGLFCSHSTHFELGAWLGVSGFLLPGKVSSNLGRSRNGTGNWGLAGTGAATRTGSTMWGVTRTNNSVLVRLTDFDRNNCPNIGISPIPGTLLS